MSLSPHEEALMRLMDEKAKAIDFANEQHAARREAEAELQRIKANPAYDVIFRCPRCGRVMGQPFECKHGRYVKAKELKVKPRVLILWPEHPNPITGGRGDERR